MSPEIICLSLSVAVFSVIGCLLWSTLRNCVERVNGVEPPTPIRRLRFYSCVTIRQRRHRNTLTICLGETFTVALPCFFLVFKIHMSPNITSVVSASPYVAPYSHQPTKNMLLTQLSARDSHKLPNDICWHVEFNVFLKPVTWMNNTVLALMDYCTINSTVCTVTTFAGRFQSWSKELQESQFR